METAIKFHHCNEEHKSHLSNQNQRAEGKTNRQNIIFVLNPLHHSYLHYETADMSQYLHENERIVDKD